MDQTNSTSRGGYGPRPPPYCYEESEDGSFTWVRYQVGKGHVSVVSPPGLYDNRIHSGGAAGGPQQITEAPPDYSHGLEESGFSDAVIRRGFIRKVYLTLMIQLLVTVGIICAFLYWATLREWALDTFWFSYCMMAVVMVLILTLSCCDNIRRRVPLNFIALGLFTVAEGLMLGSVAVYFAAEAVLWAVGATALVSFALTLFAMQSKWDFTAANGSLWVFAWTLVSFAMLCAIMRSQYLYIAYACLGTLLFSLYLVFDTQLILGGKHRKYQVSPEEYVFAALNLYLDIVSLFLLLLSLIGLCR
ncbi:protein lifeguard 1 [Platichthys flesus]|uniref:protein lifeguard 1 n=1 Tax=Platichthys flesus TaxID=8260 RepID=UPI002DB6EB54|nr:protein lifeguard 1 [Platichthys flesus]XP_062255689.1 protein lifeguard 1 [Platichthys flesus]